MSRILEHLALIEVGHTTVFDVEPTAIILQKASHVTFQRGAGGKVWEKEGASSTHLSFVREHIAAVEIGLATRVDIEPSSILFQRKASTCVTFQRGNGGKV